MTLAMWATLMQMAANGCIVVVQQPYCPLGHDVRYMAGKFDLSDFKPGGREDPVR
jgi:hypothetical protein